MKSEKEDRVEETREACLFCECTTGNLEHTLYSCCLLTSVLVTNYNCEFGST